jgi:hypothetical protein
VKHYYHWQNLNEKPGKRTGSIMRHGRAWWGAFRWEWSFLRSWEHGFGISLALCSHDDEAISTMFMLPLLGGIYCGWQNRRLYERFARWTSRDPAPHVTYPFDSQLPLACGRCLKTFPDIEISPHQIPAASCPLCGYPLHRSDLTKPHEFWITNGREIGWQFFSGTFWLRLWHDPMESRCGPNGDPWWWEMRVNIPDLLLGRNKYSDEVLETREIVVPMPEGSYTGRCTMKLETWKRPRWFAKRLVRAHIDMNEGQQIPFPGKGEDSWNCGEDATFGLCTPARDVVEATAHLFQSVMRDRARYGNGFNWRPQEKKRA